jgi:transcriptional regulator with XRE-family HTH domain
MNAKDIAAKLCEGGGMPARPAPPPWGALITAALREAGLSARAAARRAGISEGRWRQITSGYQVVSAGIYAPVRGPAVTLARMAAVAGISPAQLERAGRADAAVALAAAPAAGPGDASDAILRRVREMSTDQARELLATIAVQLGVTLAGQHDRGSGAAAMPESERQYGT